MGLIFQIVFSVRLNLLPLSGRMDSILLTTFDSKTNFYILDSILTQNWEALGSALAHLVMPVITLGLALTGVFIRLTRANMIEMLRSDFIAAGKARGISEKTPGLPPRAAQHIHPHLNPDRFADGHPDSGRCPDRDNFLLAWDWTLSCRSDRTARLYGCAEYDRCVCVLCWNYFIAYGSA